MVASRPETFGDYVSTRNDLDYPLDEHLTYLVKDSKSFDYVLGLIKVQIDNVFGK